MKVTLCGMLYRDAPVVLEMLRSTLPLVDNAVFATAPLPYMKPLPDDGTNEIAEEYAERLGKRIEFDDRPGLSHEQQNHVLEHLSDGDYAFWVAADEIATGYFEYALDMVSYTNLDGYLVAYEEKNQVKTLRMSLQRARDSLLLRSVGVALKMTIIKYHKGDHFENNHWSYYGADGRLAVQGLYKAVDGRTHGRIPPGYLTMVDISSKRSGLARERRKERYKVLRTHGWDERRL